MSKEPVPIQPVESPVICSPYKEPDWHYDYDRKTGEATKKEGRRPAYYWYKSEERVRGQYTLLETEEERRELDLVNKLRKDVKRWRDSGYPGAELWTLRRRARRGTCTSIKTLLLGSTD